jgi:hypothetical protein
MHAGPIEFDEHGAIASDLPCLDCGYNLRGLRRDGRCPECGRAVADALLGGRVRFAQPWWIDRVANGCGWLAAGLIVSLINCEVSGAEPITFVLFDVLPLGIILLGVWRLSTPDHSALAPAGYERARRWVRPAVGGWAAAALLLAGLSQARPDTAAAGFALTGLLNGLAVFATCRLGQELAGRMDEPRLARSSRLVGWVWLVMSAVVSVGGLVTAAVMGRGQSGAASGGSGGSGLTLTVFGQTYPAPSWAWPILLILVLVFLVFGIWLLVLPFQFRSRLRGHMPRLLLAKRS